MSIRARDGIDSMFFCESYHIRQAFVNERLPLKIEIDKQEGILGLRQQFFIQFHLCIARLTGKNFQSARTFWTAEIALGRRLKTDRKGSVKQDRSPQESRDIE